MIKLLNLEDKELSKGIRNLSPIQYDSIQVKNRLLDGSYHIQTIGDPLKYYTFEILSDENQVGKINQEEYRGGKLKLIIDDKYYIGMLEEKLSWERITMRHKESKDRYYIASIQFNIESEGSI